MVDCHRCHSVNHMVFKFSIFFIDLSYYSSAPCVKTSLFLSCVSLQQCDQAFCTYLHWANSVARGSLIVFFFNCAQPHCSGIFSFSGTFHLSLGVLSLLLVHRSCETHVQAICVFQHKLAVLVFMHPILLRISTQRNLYNLRNLRMVLISAISNASSFFSTGAISVQIAQSYTAIGWIGWIT